MFLATVTELPEIATTFTAAFNNHASLVLGNMFGGITMQTAILAVVDLSIVRGVLTQYPRKPTHALEAALLIILLSILLGFCLSGDVTIGFQIGLGTSVLALAYGVSIKLLRSYDAEGDWVPVDLPDEVTQPTRILTQNSVADMPTNTLILRSIVAARCHSHLWRFAGPQRRSHRHADRARERASSALQFWLPRRLCRNSARQLPLPGWVPIPWPFQISLAAT